MGVRGGGGGWGSQILDRMYARGGGGAVRCVLCATGGGGGGSKTPKKNAYVINGRPLATPENWARCFRGKNSFRKLERFTFRKYMFPKRCFYGNISFTPFP